ncbi:MAG: cyanoexosortase B, partial [Merismopedia sp. SIO2A8]|nr:cyanoexosortase B [Merismopedia sp. SIO2A8]
MTAQSTPNSFSFNLVRDRQWPTLVLASLLLLLYVPLLWHWCDGWLNKSISLEHEYFSHGLLGIPFAGYIAWQKQTQWRSLPHQTNLGGCLLLILGVVAYLSGIVDAINLSFPIVLAGLCLWLKGKQGL